MNSLVLRSLFILLLILPSAGLCQGGEVKLLVPNASAPQKAVGLVLSNDGAQQRTISSLEQLDQSATLVSFPYTEEDVRMSSLATTIVVDRDGSILTSIVTPLERKATRDPFVAVPRCKVETALDEPTITDEVLFQNLVDLRHQRYELAKERLQVLMSDEFLKKLQQLEVGFGFRYDAPLSLNLNPVTLTERLDQLFHTIQAYEIYKKRRAGQSLQ